MVDEKKEGPAISAPAKKKIILIAAALGGLVLVGGGVFGYLQWQAKKTQEEAQAKIAEKQGKAAEVKPELAEVGAMYNFESLILNLNNPGDSRYLKVTITAEISSDKLTAELDKKKPLLLDILVSTISSKAFDEIRDERGKALLKEELVERINKVLVNGRVVRLYFTEFVVQ